ncbi:LamG-like jellyroll fold domain-containing protein [uncultured Rossellomorea sp.]|uniref:LamG-like jellyroll fold domain-containing protein n=1 Tax=uncultured Rossellomorea sp. TaxID=2837549 RepID=UPI002604B740|nr:LamG-like jellyroll fold domain-containing protein [uncultured Rossellomorea sp.]
MIKMKVILKAVKIGIVGSITLSLFAFSPSVFHANNKPENSHDITESIVADWKFQKEYVKSGSINEANLIIEDTSGNENNLQLTSATKDGTISGSPFIQWSEEDYYNEDAVESLEFKNKKSYSEGQYFHTVDDAPINGETFENGFTIEAVLKLPANFSPEEHSWMGILTRKGQAADINKTGGEKEILSTLSVSSLREIQWTSHPTNLDHNETNWSFSLDSKDDWYHIAVVNNGKNSTLYINGVTDFRNTDSEMIGIDLVEGKGWNIGASEWANELDTLFAGNIQEIRIADQPLPQENWLISKAVEVEGHVENGSNEKQALLTNKENYNFLFVPDPQKTVRYMPELFYEQVKWISKKEQNLNISMTAFLGDMVDQSHSLEEWNNSSSSVDILDKHKTPYVTIAGNHDYGEGDPYLDYYGPERFADKPYYKGASPTGYSSYSVIKAGNYEYLFLSLDMQHIVEDIPWAKQVLKNHPSTPTILLSHQIINIGGDGETMIDTWRGSLIWDELVNDHNQVFMTVNGHHHGAGHRIKENAHGNEVIQMLVDYQSSYQGGNGWMRFAEFSESDDKISFKTFSPWVEKLSKSQMTYFDVTHLTGTADQFEIPFHFEKRFDFSN